MYVNKYSADIYLFEFMVRWCLCSMWRVLLPSGKLIGLLFFCLLFFLSILFFKSITYVHTKLSRNELARPVMGTIFLLLVLWMMYRDEKR